MDENASGDDFSAESNSASCFSIFQLSNGERICQTGGKKVRFSGRRCEQGVLTRAVGNVYE